MIKKYLPSLVFNVSEYILLVCAGITIHVEIPIAISILLTFMLTRNLIGNAKHYKSPILCLLWSTIIFTGLFIVSKINFILSIILTIFYATTQTDKVNVNDMFLWSGRDSRYDYITNYLIKIQDTSELQIFEDKLQKFNEDLYLIYKYKLKQNHPFSKLCEATGVDKRRICEHLKSLELAINLYFNII